MPSATKPKLFWHNSFALKLHERSKYTRLVAVHLLERATLTWYHCYLGFQMTRWTLITKKKKTLISFNKNFRHKYQNNSVKKKNDITLKFFSPCLCLQGSQIFHYYLCSCYTQPKHWKKRKKKLNCAYITQLSIQKKGNDIIYDRTCSLYTKVLLSTPPLGWRQSANCISARIRRAYNNAIRVLDGG